MTADEFSKIVRGGSDKLRVDNIVLTFGGQEFHGSGTMQIERDEIKLLVQLNGEEKFPDPKIGIHTKRDTWQLKGVIEYHLEFRCDRAAVVSPRDMFGRWQTFGLNPVYLVPSGLDAMSSGERHAFYTQGEIESQLIANEDNSVRFTASLQEYPFFEPLCGKKWEGEIEGFNFTLEKTRNDSTDLEVILNSKQDYVSAGATEDENKFQAFMSALAFLTGANAWPYRIEHRRGGKKISDMIRATGKLSRISHTPFSNGLAFDAVVGNKNWNFQDVLKKGTAFFETNSKLGKEISNLLFLFREADAKEVHSDITMISLCALFENLVQLLFRELKLEEEAKNADGTYKDVSLQSFVKAKEKLKAQISQQIDSASLPNEAEAWRRMYGVVGKDTFSIREKFQSVLKHFQFDEQWQKEMENSFKIWHEVRQHLFHYKDRTSQSEDDLKKAILDQCQIAGAINFLILKLIGYSGLMRANSFWGDYR